MGASLSFVASTLEALHEACPHDWIRAFERAPTPKELKKVGAPPPPAHAWTAPCAMTHDRYHGTCEGLGMPTAMIA